MSVVKLYRLKQNVFTSVDEYNAYKSVFRCTSCKVLYCTVLVFYEVYFMK